MNQNEIVFYSPTKAENPWVENAAADTRYTFNTAVLSLLVYMDSSFNIKPITLKSFHWDYKNNYYVLTLKEDLYFTNGRKVTIEDLEFSILRPFFAAVKNEGSMQLINIKGSEKISPGDTYKSGLVEGVKILSKNSLSVTPSAPNPSFMYTLTRSNNSLVPREEFKSDLLNWKRWPVGVGPYKIINEDKTDKTYTLELIDIKNYPNAPKIIIFEQERKYKPDITLKDLISAKDPSFINSKLTAPTGVRLFSFNYSTKLGSNPDFRKAVNLALHRNEVVRETYSVTYPLNEVVIKGGIGRVNSSEKYNLEESRKLFKKVLGNQNDSIFKIPYSPDHEYLGNKYKEIIKKQLNEAGFKVEFVLSSTLWNPFIGEFINSPFRLHGKGADFYDPLMTFTMFKKGSPAINSYPNDDKLEQLMEEAKESPNRDVLGSNVEKLSQYFLDNNTFIPLFEIPAIAYYNPKKIKSVGEQFGGQTFHLANIIMNRDE